MPWARTTEPLMWHLGNGYVEMPKGTDLELLKPTEMERSALAGDISSDRGTMRVPHLVVSWAGARRRAPAPSLVGLDDDARRMVAEAKRSVR